jgi:hypothetical protein
MINDLEGINIIPIKDEKLTSRPFYQLQGFLYIPTKA